MQISSGSDSMSIVSLFSLVCDEEGLSPQLLGLSSSDPSLEAALPPNRLRHSSGVNSLKGICNPRSGSAMRKAVQTLSLLL